MASPRTEVTQELAANSASHDSLEELGGEDDVFSIVFSTTPSPDLARHQAVFPPNVLTTYHYTLLTFLPLALFYQIRRAANIYFLFISILQLIPGLSPTGRFTTVAPLAIVVSFSMLKEALEDIRRHQADRRVNHQPTKVYSSDRGEFVSRPWSEVLSGDIALVKDGEELPADLLLIYSAGPDGTAYIQTANLDGETNLKFKQSVPDLAFLAPGADATGPDACAGLRRFSGSVVCDPPNKDLYRFDGQLRLDPACLPEGMEVAETGIRIGFDQLLLRGAVLKNTGYVWGIVVGTGVQSKIALNLIEPVYKQTRMEKTVTRIVLATALLLVVTALAVALVNAWWTLETGTAQVQLQLESAPLNPLELILSFFANVILMNGVIPISLIVSLEVVKFYLARVIQGDRAMYDTDQEVAPSVNTSNLIDELGRVTHIFSDKTGTLTQNCMRFRACSVAGKNLDQPAELPWSEHSWEAFMARHVCFDPTGLVQLAYPSLPGTAAAGGPPGSVNVQVARHFLTALAVCHSVLVRTPDDAGPDHLGAAHVTQLLFEASSPDEGALVAAAKRCGYCFFFRDTRISAYYNQHTNTTHLFQVLHEIEFDSDRKRISVIVREDLEPLPGVVLHTSEAFQARAEQLVQTTRQQLEAHPPGGRSGGGGSTSSSDGAGARIYQPAQAGADVKTRIVIYTKGADSTILARLDETLHGPTPSSGEGGGTPFAALERATRAHIEAFAREGLRTLCVAGRILSEAEFAQFYHAFTAIDQDYSRSAEQRAEGVVPLHSALESRLALLGATGIEDQLQEQVPETIQLIREAGVRVWVLTGDKVETAINIGYGARLLTQRMDVVQLVGIASSGELVDQLSVALSDQRARLRTIGFADRSVPGWYKDRAEALRQIMSTTPSLGAPPASTGAPPTSLVSGGQNSGTDRSLPGTFTGEIAAGSVPTSLPSDDDDGGGGGTYGGLGDDGVESSTDIFPTGPPTAPEFDTSMQQVAAFVSQCATPRAADRSAGAGVAQPAPALARPSWPVQLWRRFKSMVRLPTARGISAIQQVEALSSAPLGLILDGVTARTLLESPDAEKAFVQLSDLCQAVVCCRFSPKQKADLVRLVKDQHRVFADGRPPAVTLAIGDGANDVSMITAAHIGVGIAGREGRQAFLSADVGFGMFKFLRRLLVVHGRPRLSPDPRGWSSTRSTRTYCWRVV